MAACQIQHSIHIFFWVIFHLLHIDRIGSPCVGLSQQKVQHQFPQHIVHYTVQLAAAQIGPLLPVADLVGGVFPNFPDQGGLRIRFFQFAVKGCQEFVG